MMARSEFEKRLRVILDTQPFQPFAIELDDGQIVSIQTRQAISYLTGDSALCFSSDDSMFFVDCENVKQIVAVSPAGSS